MWRNKRVNEMLKGPPSDKQLSRMYYELSQEGAKCSGAKLPWPYHLKNREEKIALAAEMSRYDPRLLGILVEYLLNHGRDVSPQELRRQYLRMGSPQAMAVVAEFVKSAGIDKELLYLMEYLQRGLEPVPIQFYFKQLYAPGGKLGQQAAEKTLAEYKKWGFLARERPTVDVYKKKTVGRMDQDSRLNVLKDLFKKKSEIQLKDYLTTLGTGVSRQQALQDLKKMARLKPGTRGRGAKWILSKGA